MPHCQTVNPFLGSPARQLYRDSGSVTDERGRNRKSDSRLPDEESLLPSFPAIAAQSGRFDTQPLIRVKSIYVYFRLER